MFCVTFDGGTRLRPQIAWSTWFKIQSSRDGNVVVSISAKKTTAQNQQPADVPIPRLGLLKKEAERVQ